MKGRISLTFCSILHPKLMVKNKKRYVGDDDSETLSNCRSVKKYAQ